MAAEMNNSRVLVTRRNAGNLIRSRTIQRRCIRVLKHLERPDAHVSILLCDDAFIQSLNLEFRGQDHSTDVLSFSMSEGEALQGNPSLLGDIVISVETATRQAPEINHTPTEEVTSLMIHGLLHLLGYNHSSKRDDRKMQQCAREMEALVLKRSKPKA